MTEAIIHLEEALEPNEDNPQLLALLGNTYLKYNAPKDAERYLSKAATLNPYLPNVRTQLAITHLVAGDAERGTDELRSVANTGPSFVRAELLLLLVHLRNQQYQEALTLAPKGPRATPRGPKDPKFNHRCVRRIGRSNQCEKAL